MAKKAVLERDDYDALWEHEMYEFKLMMKQIKKWKDHHGITQRFNLHKALIHLLDMIDSDHHICDDVRLIFNTRQEKFAYFEVAHDYTGENFKPLTRTNCSFGAEPRILMALEELEYFEKKNDLGEKHIIETGYVGIAQEDYKYRENKSKMLKFEK